MLNCSVTQNDGERKMADRGTKLITLIGTPLGQSYAARMQNKAYEVMGETLYYSNTEADEKMLPEVIKDIRSKKEFVGAAVTKPNKVSVIPLLDELDPLCEKIGACNTIVKLPDGRLKGFNTDALGFLGSLREDAGIESIEDMSFFCFGVGGAGRAIASALAYFGAKKVYLTARTEENVLKTVNDVNTRIAPVAKAVKLSELSVLLGCDVIINATGVGMGETMGMTPLAKEHMPTGKLYFDACYNPQRTRFLSDAEQLGNKTLNGLGMSLYQGAAQIELWTGRKAPLEAMRSELIEIISEK